MRVSEGQWGSVKVLLLEVEAAVSSTKMCFLLTKSICVPIKTQHSVFYLLQICFGLVNAW